MIYFRTKKALNMNFAIAGYGKMGHEVETIAKERGHLIKLIVDLEDIGKLSPETFAGVDAVIEFTVPEAAPEVISSILKSSVPVVSGTTGWLSRYDEISALAIANNTAFLHSSNFSPGLYMVSRLNSLLASYMLLIPGYKVSIDEIHHLAKIDSPSGTAIMLAEQIVKDNENYRGWLSGNSVEEDIIPISSAREGTVPGTHSIKWTSGIDSITICHEAYSRKGFALGAVLSAEYITGKKGIFKMRDIFGF